jgi:methionine-gamma-lyase
MTEENVRSKASDGEGVAGTGWSSPASLMMGYGYRPEWSEGSLKCPIFQTSTFVFETAEDGKRFFEVAYGLREPEEGEHPGLIYSRLNNPDLEILEDRLTLWEGAEKGLVFASGMAAIGTSLLTYLRPGDAILHTSPLYGGTDHLLTQVLPEFGIEAVSWEQGMSESDLEKALGSMEGRLKMVYVETPANPTNCLFDIDMAARLAAEFSSPDRKVLVAVDNTFLGPLWQRPLDHGADLVLYSATKYLGGHSDLVAGACLGSREMLEPIAGMRTFLGTMADPQTGWMLMRSLETLKLRFTAQTDNARAVAPALADHPKVTAVHYPGLLQPGDAQYDLYKRQCSGPGALISFELAGGEPAAFRFLNNLKLVKLAVSLGGTESLAEHPASMTHAGVEPVARLRYGITDGLVRLSIGVEDVRDLMADILAALDAV